MTEWRGADEKAATEKRVADHEAKEEAVKAKKLKAAVKANVAAEVPLVISVAELDDKLESYRGQANSHKVEFLKHQIDARVLRFTPKPPAKGKPYPFEWRKGCKGGVLAEVAHLTAEVKKMIEYDVQQGRNMAAPAPDEAGLPQFKRPCPTAGHLQTHASKVACAADEAERQAAAEQSDPELVELESRFLDKKFIDTEEESTELWQVHAIKYSEQKAQWFAECVKLDDTTELIPESSKTPGGEILISALQDYYPESLGAMIEDYEARRAI